MSHELLGPSKPVDEWPGMSALWLGNVFGWTNKAWEGTTAEEAYTDRGKRISVACVPKGTLPERLEAMRMAKQNLESAIAAMEGRDLESDPNKEQTDP